MTNPAKLAEFIRADWEAKRQAFAIAVESPFVWTMVPEPPQSQSPAPTATPVNQFSAPDEPAEQEELFP